MKKLLIAPVLLAMLASTAAYTPISDDYDFLEVANDYVDERFPQDIDVLVDGFDKLGSIKIPLRIQYGERGLWLYEELHHMLQEQLFTQSDICTSQHTQYGDTVELAYRVSSESGALLRAPEKPLVFNPGKQHVWKSLDTAVLGLQAQDYTQKRIRTVGVKADEGSDTLTKELSANEAQKKGLPTPYVGQEVSFASTMYDGVAVGTISHIEGDTLHVDFTHAPTDSFVRIDMTLQQLRKGCQ